jgi:hypothetical protein
MNKFLSDVKHMSWLFRQMLKCIFIEHDLHEARECWFWIKILWNYQSRKIG